MKILVFEFLNLCYQQQLNKVSQRVRNFTLGSQIFSSLKCVIRLFVYNINLQTLKRRLSIRVAWIALKTITVAVQLPSMAPKRLL